MKNKGKSRQLKLKVIVVNPPNEEQAKKIIEKISEDINLKYSINVKENRNYDKQIKTMG